MITRQELEKMVEDEAFKQCTELSDRLDLSMTNSRILSAKCEFESGAAFVMDKLMPELNAANERIKELEDRLYHESRNSSETKYLHSKFVDRMKELGQAMPPNAISMNIQKALKELTPSKESEAGNEQEGGA